jgi:hypothetical protein
VNISNKKVVVDDAGFDVGPNVRYQSCWYCDHLVDQQEDDCWFTFEFDSWYHISCLKRALLDATDEEAQIIAQEYRTTTKHYI